MTMMAAFEAEIQRQYEGLRRSLELPLWGDPTLTRIHYRPVLFPRAARWYARFWEAAHRAEVAWSVLRHGEQEDPW